MTADKAGFTQAYQNAAKEGTDRVQCGNAGTDVKHGEVCQKMRDPTEEGRANVASEMAKTVLAATATPRCLDVGCAVGGDLGKLQDALRAQGCKDFELHGVDLLEAQLVRAREAMPSATFTAGDVKKLPYPDCHFDLVHCSRLLIHVPEIDEAIGEMLRVLRPGGRATFCEGNMALSHVITSDERVRKVVKVLEQFTLDMCQNPHVGTDLYKKLLQRLEVESVELAGYPMIQTTDDFMAYEKGPLQKLVENGKLTEEDVSYYMDTAPRLFREGDLIRTGNLFVSRATKKQ